MKEWRVCEFCGRKYIAVTAKQRFCSEECSREHHKIAYREIKDKRRASYCGSCIFNAPLHNSVRTEKDMFCAFSLMTGRSRKCPPGEGCTKRIRRREK